MLIKAVAMSLLSTVWVHVLLRVGAICHTEGGAICHTEAGAVWHTESGAMCHTHCGAVCHTESGAMCHKQLSTSETISISQYYKI